MKFPELRFVKFAAAAAVTEPDTVGESIERSCMAFGMLGAIGLAKKEAGLLTEDDQRLIDKVARVCRNTYKFAKVLNNSMKFLDGDEAIHRTLSDLAYGAMSSKVAYARTIPLGKFDRIFENIDSDNVAEKLASLSNTSKLLKIADAMQEGVDDLDDSGEDIENQMASRMRKKEEKPDEEDEEDEEGEEEGEEMGMEGGDATGGTIPPDVLSQLLQRLHSSYYEPLNEGMEMGGGQETDTSEVARLLAQMGAGEEQPDSIAPILAALSMAGQHA